MKLPKGIYPKELSDHDRFYGNYVLARTKEGVLLAFPCSSPYIKQEVRRKLHHSKKMKIERGTLV